MHSKGVLLIHGLTGSPREFDPISQALAIAGYQTHQVELPGHGDSPNCPFYETSALEVLNHCAAEYERFSKNVDEVYVVGHSLGGMCTVLTAAVQPPKLKGIVAFSTPYEHAFVYNYPQGFTRMPFPHLVKGLSYAPQHRTKFRKPGIRPRDLPRFLQQSKLMFQLMREHVPKIEVPVSLAHSLYDLTIPYTEMQKLARNIGKPELVTTHTLTGSGHRIFPISPDIDPSLKLIMRFLERDCHEMSQAYEQSKALISVPS